MQPNRKTNPIMHYQDSQVLMAKNIGKAWADYLGQYGEYCADMLLFKFKLDDDGREGVGEIPVKNYFEFLAASKKPPAENGIAGCEMGIIAFDFD